jgi:putative phosphoribosyl transferase
MQSNNKPGKVRLLSHDSQPFSDRIQAGQMLARESGDLRGKKAVVLGIPRGGIIVARELAKGIEADLDIVLARKLGTPGQQELAMGSVSEDGNVFLNEEVVRTLGVTRQQIEQEKAVQMAEIQRRNRLIRGVLPKTVLKGRIVILTDDGVATGATMQAALWAVRQEQPKKLIVAIPVASDEAIERLAQDADEILCLRQPPYFNAVGQFYVDFYQVQDQEVLQILTEEARRRKNKVESGK